MAGGVNKAILIGHLGADPEVRFTPSGQAVANFRMATSEAWTDKSGQRQERTEWHRIVVWGKQAELCGKYLKKGRQCYVEGRLQTREWTDKRWWPRTWCSSAGATALFRDAAGAPTTSGRRPRAWTRGPHPPAATTTFLSEVWVGRAGGGRCLSPARVW